jgi:hypothetical protein
MSLFDAFNHFFDVLGKMESAPKAAAKAIIDDLEAKGDANAIARYLESIGITGIPGDGALCPIANYLHTMLPDIEFQVTDTVAIEGGEDDEIFKLPPNCIIFITAFDSGEYPKLSDSEDDFDENDDYDDEDDDFED